MPECLASDQFSTGMNKNAVAGTSLVSEQGALGLYRNAPLPDWDTEPQIPMPAALALMLMTSCGYYLATSRVSNMCAAGNKTIQYYTKKCTCALTARTYIHVSTKTFTLNTMKKRVICVDLQNFAHFRRNFGKNLRKAGAIFCQKIFGKQ
jgi:hypothetical protein